MSEAMTLALFPMYGRGSMRVISPDGCPEDAQTVTDIFHGILTATARRLQDEGRQEEAASIAKNARPVSLDLEGMLRVGYRIEGVPESIWNLLLIGHRATA